MSIAMSAEPTSANPNYAASPAQPPSSPRLKHEGLSDEERNYSIFMHLSPFLAAVFQPLIIAPLVLWLMRKDDSVFNDDHGREVLNFMISMVLLTIILGVTIIGIAFLPVIYIVAIVNMIRGAVAAGNGEYFRYPMTWRFIS